MGRKFLSGNENDSISNEACYVASNISIFFLKSAEFVCSVDKYPSVVKKRFLNREVGQKI